MIDAALRQEEKGDLRQALEFAKRAVALDPNGAEANLVVGRILAKTRSVPEAVSHLTKTLQIDQDCFDAMIWLVPLLRSSGSLEEALRIATRARELRPDDAASHSLLGSCLLALDRHAEAAESYRRAIELAPGQAFLHRNLGDALRRTGALQEVILCYRRSLELDPHSVATLVALAQAVSMDGNRSAGAKLYRQAHALEPNTTRGLLNLARAQIDEEDPAGAEKTLREALRSEPRSYLGNVLLGSVLRRLGRFDEAETALRHAISINPKGRHAYADLVFCRKLKPEDRPLIDELAAMAADPAQSPEDRSQLEYALGKALDDIRDDAQAMAHFDEANRIMLELRRRRNPQRAAESPEPMFSGGTPEELARVAARGFDSDRPVLIIGMMRSGTTLLERMLSCHTRIAGAGELDFWPNALERRDVRPDDLPALGRAYAELLASKSGALRMVDKMPGNYRRVGAIHAALPKARFIHIRRHPVDTCLSIWMTPNRVDVPFAHDRSAIVHAYREYERLMERWQALLPQGVLISVRYEDLVQNPEPVVRSLTDFLGLPFEEACLHPETNRSQVETPSLWQARQPLYRTSIARWQRYEPWLGEFRSLL